MSIEIIIIPTPPNKQNFAGGMVEGTVEVKVDAQDKQGSPAEMLILKIEGYIETSAWYKPFWGKHEVLAKEKRELISQTIELASFVGKAPHGTHIFPFAFVLPPNIPGSMQEEKSSISSSGCKVSYSYQAYMSRPGMLNFDVKSDLPLKVLAKRQGLFAPQLVGPETRPVMTWCCLNGGGSTSFAFLVDSQAVGRADDIGVTMVARNDSLSTFESLGLEVHQQTRWIAEGHKAYRQRKIASGIFEGNELCVSKKMDSARRASKVAEDASGDLKQTLANGGGTRYALTIPDTCAYTTVSLPNIVVTHSLVVKLTTSTCREEHSLSIPLFIYQGASVGEGQPEGTPLVRVLSQSPEQLPQMMTDSTAHNTLQPQQPFPLQQQPTGYRVQPIEDQMQHAPQDSMLQQGYPTQQQPTGFEEQAAARSELTQVTITGSPPVGAPAGGTWDEKNYRGESTFFCALLGTGVSVLFPAILGPATSLLAPAGLLVCLCPCDERMVYVHSRVHYKEDGRKVGWCC